MDPFRLIVRATFAFVFIFVLLRVSGERTVKRGDVASFAVALIIGDMFDDLIWAEVAAAQFVVGVGTLLFVHFLVAEARFKSGTRRWQYQAGRR
jgi:uncharacterized membrane protein YcaP (DUF421 family)